MNPRTYFTPANGYNPRFAQRRPARKMPLFYSAVDADLVWAAAAFAYRVNDNQFFKEQNCVFNESTQATEVRNQPNKVVAMTELRDNLAAGITDADFDLGRQARRFHQLTLTAQALKAPLSDFQRTVLQSAGKEVFFLDTDRLEFAVVASQIRAYIKAEAEIKVREDVEREPVAAVGAKVNVNVTVVRSAFSQNYGCYFVTAKTDSRHMVFFSFREGLAEGTRWNVKATVKAYRDNTTQLTRAKIGPTL